MFLTMVILAAFSVLYTYTSSVLLPLPRGQKWGSNTFSSSHKHSFYPWPRWVIFGDECWHNTTSFTTTANNALKPRKRVRTKPYRSVILHISTMPTSRDLAVASILDSESIIDRITNEDEADNFVNNIQVRNFPVFSPPGARPNRAATTKTKLKADAKALKTRKAQADEDKKRATAERRHEAQAKKREKAIVAAEVRADKAAQRKQKPFGSSWNPSKRMT